MLLLYLIHNDILASDLSELRVDESARNSDKNEHIEKNEDDKEYIVRLVVLDCQKRIVWVVVVSSHCINLINHIAQMIVILFVYVGLDRVTGIDVVRVKGHGPWAYEGKDEDKDTVIDHEYK